MSHRDDLTDAVARLEDLTGALTAGVDGPQDTERITAEAVRASEEITRLLTPVLEERG